MIWMVIWVVLMLFWLFGGGYAWLRPPTPNYPVFVGASLIPWLCVLILGLYAFGAFGPVGVWR